MYIWSLSDELFGLLVGHMIGDFLFQTDWMSKHKRSSTPACMLHVAVYTLCVMLFTGWAIFQDRETCMCLIAGIALPHFLIDRLNLAYHYMNFRHPQAVSPLYWPWALTIIEQTMHLLCLYATLLLLHWRLQWPQ
jgi:hypothetical protein